jgi:hypothetical protein
MAVITSTVLLVRRINDLMRRRAALAERHEQLRRALPDWAVTPLQLVGMTAEEIRGYVDDLAQAEAESGVEQIDRELETIDREIEGLEDQLLASEATSLDGIAAVVDLALARLRGQTVSDPGDVFYDYGDARILMFVERIAADVHALLGIERRRAS